MLSVDVKDLNVSESTLTDTNLQLFKNKTRHWPKTPFPIDINLNKKVILYDGKVRSLKADAIVNPTDESFTQMAFVNEMAGPELESYIRKKVRICATGDVRVTPGFESNFRSILHAVPPKYQPKYKTAAETALFHTYFRILETMIEKKIRTVVIPVLATLKCNLPIEDNFHLQLRVIRRILERKGQEFDRIVVYVDDMNQFALPFFCFFPRTSIDEEIACYYFHGSIGGPNGEPVIPGREIRIKSKPGVLDPSNQSIDLYSGLDLSTVVGKTPFSKMQDDLDKQRMAMQAKKAQNQVALRRNPFRGCNLL